MDTLATPHDYQGDLDQIVSDLFRTMLATEISPAAEHPPQGDDTISAFMAFAGAWKGDLVVQCHRPQADSFAKRFLQTETLDESGEDARATIAELANIIAGNLKVVLPTGVSIGTPLIIDGTNYTLRVRGGNTICHRAYSSDAGAFLLRLIEDSTQTGDRK